MLNTSVVCFLASYSCALACELARLKWRLGFVRLVALAFAAAGFVAHTFYLLKRARAVELAPLLSSAHDWLLVLAWIAVLIYLFVSMADAHWDTGIVIWPVVLILVVAAQFVPASPSYLLDSLRGWKMLHAATLVLGTAGILVGFVLSMLYLWQHRRLKQRQNYDDSVKLPNLELIAKLNRWSILVAVPLLTIGIASGVGLSVIPKEIQLSNVVSDPVVIGGAVTWTLMGVVFFWLLLQKRSPGRQVALLTAWSCGFLLVTLVGLEMLIAVTGQHGVHGTPDQRTTQSSDTSVIETKQ